MPDQVINPLLNTSVQNLSGSQFIGSLLRALISLGFVVGAVIFIFILITGSIQWMASGGDKVSLENARRRLFTAIIGVFILFSIYAMINLVQCFFRINILQFTIGTLNIGGGPAPFCKYISGGGAGGATNANCPCGGGAVGYCASTGQIGQLNFGGPCYQCTTSGWIATGTTGCPVISCGACP